MGKMPLKTVLKNFLDHYQNLETSLNETTAAVKELAQSGRSTPPPLSLYAQEFLKLKELTETLKNDPNYPMIDGHSDVNRKKNRYKDILPYDNSRVILSEYPGVPGSDYINANYVRGSSGNQRAYIASQGPLPNTLVDFWRMIWETEVLVIVMACNEREAGKYKCEPYWPFNTEDKQQYGNITVEHVKWRQVCPDFLVRTFRVCADNQERTICQFHYTTWPDHGVPSSVHPILELVRLMRDVQSTESRPILVHCSAGCGRTGTICSIDYVWALLRTGKLREDFSLFEIISDMRRQRIAMVQTVEQYMLCYKAVSTLFEQHLKLIDTHTYENIDDDGEPLGIKSTIEDDESCNLESSTSTVSCNNSTDISLNPHLKITSIENKSSNDLDDYKKSESNYNQEHLKRHSLSGSCEEVRPHERLVGKATVIRRPSIAALKAIFDNPSTSSSNSSEDQQRSDTSVSTRNSKLQRSQSIKENIRNLNFNFHLEINQPKAQSRKVKSYTLSAAKLSVYKKNLSFANLTFHTDRVTPTRTKVSDVNFSENSSDNSVSNISQLKDQLEDRGQISINVNSDSDCQLNGSSRQNEITHSTSEVSQNINFENMNQKENQNENNQNGSGKPQISSYSHIQQRSKSQMHIRPPSMDDSAPSAPPKPPRTYQHVVDDSCIVRTSEGRLIVTVAQPRQHNIEANFIPINVPNSQFSFNQDGMIYDQLAARKYNISTPNLTIPDQMTFFSSRAPSTQFNIRQAAIRPRFCDNSNNVSSIYQNPLMSKSFPRPMLSGQHSNPHDNFTNFKNNLSYIDVLSNQHFQHHQAKPIILQPNYYDPIYGTSPRQPFLPPRQPIHPPTSSYSFSSANRPPSISHGNFRNTSSNLENIYSNREMCVNLKNSQKAFDSITTKSNNTVSIHVQPHKENVYAEINNINKRSKSNLSDNKNVQINNEHLKNKTNNSKNSESGKSSPLGKIRNAFKVFRIKSSSGNSSKVNGSKAYVSNKSINPNSSTTSESNGIKIINGTAINPLNGQPLSRPPHSHRFQTPTQWTQV